MEIVCVENYKRRLDMGRRFRNAMVNFKSENYLEVYLKKFTEEIPKIMPKNQTNEYL